MVASSDRADALSDADGAVAAEVGSDAPLSATIFIPALRVIPCLARWADTERLKVDLLAAEGRILELSLLSDAAVSGAPSSSSSARTGWAPLSFSSSSSSSFGGGRGGAEATTESISVWVRSSMPSSQ
jgi:hypothetical protein